LGRGARIQPGRKKEVQVLQGKGRDRCREQEGRKIEAALCLLMLEVGCRCACLGAGKEEGASKDYFDFDISAKTLPRFPSCNRTTLVIDYNFDIPRLTCSPLVHCNV
jgi:hypothetical protein